MLVSLLSSYLRINVYLRNKNCSASGQYLIPDEIIEAGATDERPLAEKIGDKVESYHQFF